MGEMPLVIFTVLSQLAAGAMVTLWLLDSANKNISIATGKFIAGSLVGITAFSILASLFHLGHPFEAYRALTHVGSSWLSREVALFSLFLIATVIYYRQWQEGKGENRKKLGGVAALIAVLAVISSGMVYVLPAMPAWNNFSPVVFFLLTGALLGSLYVGVVLRLKGDRSFNLTVVISTIIGIYMVSFAIYLSVLISGSAPQALTGLAIINSSAFWLHAAFSWIIPFFMLITGVYRKQKYSLNYLMLALMLTVVGEILGRELFYSSIVALQTGAF